MPTGGVALENTFGIGSTLLNDNIIAEKDFILLKFNPKKSIISLKRI